MNSELPAAKATYCLPFTSYVMGPMAISPPAATLARFRYL
jgi:hypothetical protein